LKAGHKPRVGCPECGGRVRKVFRPVGIVFKGPGFHSTDYRDSKGSERKDEPAGTTAESKKSD
jgi:predicted nucleic acid-binding Zn ribbon protein